MAQERVEFSVNGWNADYVIALYEQWQVDPTSVEAQWQQFFRGVDVGARLAELQPAALPGGADSGDVAHTDQARVDQLIYEFRDIGHLAAKIDPLGAPRPAPEYLAMTSFGLGEGDLETHFSPSTLPLPESVPLREIIDHLQTTYCGHIGVEYMHIQDRNQRRWLQERMEPIRNRPQFTRDEQIRILRELIEADALENFLSVRYRGKKRFSLEGGESLIPMVNELINLCPGHGIQELTIGMAHRGRLNVLVNIMNKTYDQLFTEFDEAWVEDFLEGGGDVKYHRGYSSDKVTSDGSVVRLTLSPNPSHLEFVNPVVLGRARAKQRTRMDTERAQCVPLLIHGDASFPAQGIVAETLNMAHLDGYTVGGAVHVIINNQIGFTTNPTDAHSGIYCTDVAKMVEAPIFHVNGDDPEACVFVAKLALAYRQQFKKDVVIDLWGYRKYGHNEGDEPTFTQPLLYKAIKAQKPVVNTYCAQLIERQTINQQEYDGLYAVVRHDMDQAQTRSKEQPVAGTVGGFQSTWAGLTEAYADDPVETGVPIADLEKVAAALGSVPGGFNLHRKLAKLLAARGSVVRDDKPLDWAMGELLAYGTLLLEGHAVRLTGQDVERGTFSHRHALLFDQETGAAWESLNAIQDGQARMCIHNSPLTESACVAFEYGYSLGDPNMLVLWEAQFGDFANGAQVIIDQFIASAQIKWNRASGFTMLLPHGYEGQGPEHSSARIERFLTLCAGDNMQVVYPTTPSQMFHVLRRQMKRRFRKPLIIMTPKSLLRHPRAVSPVRDLVEDRFHHVLDDAAVTDPSRINRVALCTGKVYYDLIAHREKVQSDDVAIVRLEQLYPLRTKSLEPVLGRYPGAKLVWVQEEPENMGAWRYIEDQLREKMDLMPPYIGRDANASPAVASEKMHKQEQERIMVSAIGLADAPISESAKVKAIAG